MWLQSGYHQERWQPCEAGGRDGIFCREFRPVILSRDNKSPLQSFPVSSLCKFCQIYNMDWDEFAGLTFSHSQSGSTLEWLVLAEALSNCSLCWRGWGHDTRPGLSHIVASHHLPSLPPPSSRPKQSSPLVQNNNNNIRSSPICL